MEQLSQTNLKVSELLIGHSFDRRRVNGLSHVLLGQGDGVLSNDCLSRRSVSGNEDRLVALETNDGLLLKRVQFERPDNY